MTTNKYKKNEKKMQSVSEPQAIYNMDPNALKLAGIDALMSINNPDILEKAVKGLLKHAKAKPQEEETISKEEILAGIREGLLEIKERRRTGKKGIHLQELIDEL